MSNIDKLTKLVGQSLTEGFMLGCIIRERHCETGQSIGNI